MRKIAAIVLFLVMSLGVSAYAADIQMTEMLDKNKVVLSGYAENNDEDVPTYINVFKKDNHLVGDTFSLDKAYADLETAVDKKTVLVYSDYTKTESGGSFSFTVKIDKLVNAADNSPVSGYYVANIKCGDTEYQYEFQFVDSEEKKQREEALLTLGKIKELPEDERFAALDTLLSDNLYSFVNYMDLLNKVDKTKVHTMIHGYMEETGYDVTDTDETFKCFKKLIVMQALNEGKIDSIKDFENELMISDSEMESRYTDSMVNEAMKKAITERLSQKNIADIDTYEDCFKEALILEYVRMSDGIANVRDIVKEHADEIGVDFDDISDGALRSVMGTSYESYSTLASALLGYEEESDSGRGSGGGGGSYAIPPVEKEPVADEPQKTQFVDLGSVEWAREAIEALHEENIISGKSSTHFAPMDYVTREEFIKLLVLTAGMDSRAESLPFEDVSLGAWYYDVVSIAYGNNIINGISDSQFGIGKKITRQDMAVMVGKMLEARNAQPEDKNASMVFADGDEIANYAKAYVEKLQLAGIMNGYADGSFKPAGYTTRAEAAKVIYSLLSLLR